MVNNKYVFWQALIFTVIIFAFGIMVGYFIESYRSDKTETNLMYSEINLLDAQIESDIIKQINLSCDTRLQRAISFADSIYEDAMKFEEYEAVGKFNKDQLLLVHKRYDLLRTMLWLNVQPDLNKCQNFHTLIYFFDYGSENVELRAKQATFSRLLVDIKEKYPEKILLIPIAGNLNISSVDLIMNIHEVKNRPSILIDEKKVVEDLVTIEQLEKLVFSK